MWWYYYGEALSDLAGFLISVTAIFVARLPANAKMSLGFARDEVLGAFISILFIWSLTAALVPFAVYRIFNPEPVNGCLMLALGCIGLAVNLALGLVLSGDTDDLQADNPGYLLVQTIGQLAWTITQLISQMLRHRLIVQLQTLRHTKISTTALFNPYCLAVIQAPSFCKLPTCTFSVMHFRMWASSFLL